MLSLLLWLRICFCVTLVRRARAMPSVRQPCRGNHRPKKDAPFAQTGYDGYCKACYKQRFPDKYAAKQRSRKRACRFCFEDKEIVRDGMCKTCLRERACQEEGCSWVNVDLSPVRCTACAGLGKNSVALAARCAMRCPTHTSEEDRGLELCRGCADSRAPCDVCRLEYPRGLLVGYACVSSNCGERIQACSACSGNLSRRGSLECATCWDANGRLCLLCHRTAARSGREYRRSCKACFGKRACTECRAMPPPSMEVHEARVGVSSGPLLHPLSLRPRS